jgi:putative tryptophan/tyrosine transport system substrate-binding protein
MRRRAFLSLLGGAAVVRPVAARAQQPDRMRRIGVLASGAAHDPGNVARNAAFLQALQQLGWAVGRNVQIEYRSAEGSADDLRKYVAELVALRPDVILSSGATSTGALLQATRAVPIVFTVVSDPVGSGFVDSLARPGGNATGFMQFEYGLSGKWLELLKQIAPNVTRVSVLWDPTAPSGIGQFAVIQSVAPSFGVELRPVKMRDAAEIENSVSELSRSSNAGLIVTASVLAVLHRDVIVKLAAKLNLPAIYFQRQFVDDGGLISYGSDWVDQHRRAASYVDRILRGEKPADLPVQAPTKYELVINLRAAKALSLTLPPSVLARADDVIE